MANYEKKIFYVTQEQYDILKDNGTVGSYTGIDSDATYFVRPIPDNYELFWDHDENQIQLLKNGDESGEPITIQYASYAANAGTASSAGTADTATNLTNIPTIFSGTFPLVVNAEGTLYSHSTATYAGATATLNVPNIATAAIKSHGSEPIDVYSGLKMDSNAITELPMPENPRDAATKEYVDDLESFRFKLKDPVKAASTTNVNIAVALNTLDGYTLAVNDRVLLKNQTSQWQNGVYQLNASKIPVKVGEDSTFGNAVFVENGNINKNCIYTSSGYTWSVFAQPTYTAADVGAESSFSKNTAFNKNYGTTTTDVKMNGTQAVGSVDAVARIDHVHPTDTSRQAVITGGATTITSSNLTASRALVSDGSGKVAVSAVTSTELGYLDGVTSAIQTQLGTKQATITGGASTITSSNLTASRALISDAYGKVDVSTITSTQLGHLSGVSSNIQTQLNGKANTNNATFTGYIRTPQLILDNPIQNFNAFTSYKIHDSVQTNLLAGKWRKLKVTWNGVENPTMAQQLTDLNYEGFNNIAKGLDGDPDHIINIDFVTNGLYSSNGVGYPAGKLVLNFYTALLPSAWSCRVKNRDGIWTAMSLTQQDSQLIGTIPISNYLTNIEITLSTGTGAPYISSGTIKWALTEIEYFANRMNVEQSAAITSVGGYISGNLEVGSLLKVSGQEVYHPGNKPTWTDIGSKPSWIGAYKPEYDVTEISNNGSHQSLDQTLWDLDSLKLSKSEISAWAKEPTKPEYAWSEIGSKPSFATVATSGSYNDLSNKPSIPAAQVAVNWNSASGITAILNKPNLATVATSGSYNDLSNKPTIPSIPSVMDTTEGNTGTATTQRTINAANLKSIILNHSPAGSRPSSWSQVSDKPSWIGAYKPEYDVAEISDNGSQQSLEDTLLDLQFGKLNASDISAWAKESTKPSYNWDEIGSKPSWIGATKPSYSWSEIGSKPTWIGATKPSYNWDEIGSKPSFATVATSGSYNDLSNKPTIPSIPSVMDTTEGNTGTATTQRTINAVNLKSIILNHSPAGSRPASDVSSWAKAASRPVYDVSEITDNGSQQSLEDTLLDLQFGKLNTGDISSWAKASTKPEYTAAEVGALPLTGNAASATYASAVATSAENTGTTSRYILFANSASGNQALKTNTGLTYHPTNNALTATKFIGALTGNADTATTATKLGSATVGSTQLPIYLNAGTATAITQANLRIGLFGATAIGSASQPIYLAANGVPTAITGAIGNNTTGTAANVTGTVAIANGGTGQTTKANAFNALSPMTSVGDIIYGATGGAGTRLAGNITTTRQFLRSVGSGTQAVAPSWDTVTKTDVGLSNVDNTSDANKPVSTATQTALNLKANLASPALTGTPTAPTAATATNTTQIATTAFVKAQGYAASGHNHDTVYLGIGATAADSSKLNGQLASFYQQASTAMTTSHAANAINSTDISNWNAKQDALGFTPYNATNPAGYITLTPVTNKINLKSDTDNRNINTAPNDYNSKFEIKGLKTNTVIGITGGGTYSALLGIRGWTDSSGGEAHELAFDSTGRINHRYGTTTAWNAWKTLIESDDARLTDTRTPKAHVLNSASHTVSGLTTGQFLKATSATSFGFAAHGLTAADVGALPLTGGTLTGTLNGVSGIFNSTVNAPSIVTSSINAPDYGIIDVSSDFRMDYHTITELATPENPSDAATKGYVDNLVSAIPSIPSVMDTTEGNTGTATTQRTINAANLKSIILNHSPAGARPSSWSQVSDKPSWIGAYRPEYDVSEISDNGSQQSLEDTLLDLQFGKLNASDIIRSKNSLSTTLTGSTAYNSTGLSVVLAANSTYQISMTGHWERQSPGATPWVYNQSITSSASGVYMRGKWTYSQLDSSSTMTVAIAYSDNMSSSSGVSGQTVTTPSSSTAVSRSPMCFEGYIVTGSSSTTITFTHGTGTAITPPAKSAFRGVLTATKM